MRWKSITYQSSGSGRSAELKKKHAENTHINIHVDSTIDGGENTCSGENTHTYPKSFIYKFSVKFDGLA